MMKNRMTLVTQFVRKLMYLVSCFRVSCYLINSAQKQRASRIFAILATPFSHYSSVYPYIESAFAQPNVVNSIRKIGKRKRKKKPKGEKTNALEAQQLRLG